VISRHSNPDCIVLVDPFVSLYKLKNPFLNVVNHADVHYLEKFGLREVAHNSGNMSKHTATLVNIARQEFGTGCLCVGIAERSI